MIEASILAFVVATYANLGPLAARADGLQLVLGVLILMLVAIPATIQVLVRRRSLVIDTPWLAMLFFLAAVIASTFAARDAPTALAWVSSYLTEGILLYLLVVNAVRSELMLRRIAWALVLTGGLLGAMSAYQEVTSAYDQQFGGLAQRNLERGATEQTIGKGPFRAPTRVVLGNRAAGPIGDPNRYAQMLLVVVPLAVFLARRADSRRSRLAAVGSGLAILCGIFLSYSRGGLMALVVLVSAMVALQLLRWREVLAAFVVALLLATTLAPGTRDRLQSIGGVGALLADRTTASTDGAVRGRMTEMLAALRVFEDHPLLGVGPGHFAPYYSVDYMSDPDIAFRRILRPRRAHNLYLELAAETGLAGLVGFLGVSGVLLSRLARARRRWLNRAPEQADLAAAYASALIAYLATGFFLQLAYQRYFWLVAALAGATASVLLASPAPELEPSAERRASRPASVPVSTRISGMSPLTEQESCT